jgi:hypothetical protein
MLVGNRRAQELIDRIRSLPADKLVAVEDLDFLPAPGGASAHKRP